ncbi:hypothetical protein BX666DRAFT_673370 [Dichotomocladium elegans]|nr:hypothetical protein BX666DRAFT_673370 [Dichotomocladium elegans]
MRKYRIDSYFDYLLGNPYKFHTEPGEKYSGCLVMGNYQKRKANYTETDIRSADEEAAISAGHTSNPSLSSKRRRRDYDLSHDDEDDGREEDSDHTEDDHGDTVTTHRTPIVHAGSRKRRSHMPAMTIPHKEEDNEDPDVYNPSTSPELQEEDASMYLREYLREDEEDELASTSSSISLVSYTSGTTATNAQPEHQQQNHEQNSSTGHAINPSSPNLIESADLPPSSHDDPFSNTHTSAEITAGPSSDTPHSPSTPCRPPPVRLLSPPLASPQRHSSSTLALSSTSSPTCHNCLRLQDTVSALYKDIVQLKEQFLTIEERLRQETESKAKLAMRIENLCNHYEKWRTVLAEQLLENPFSDDQDNP